MSDPDTRQRRQNKIAKDLGSRKYHQRVVPNKKALYELAPKHHEGVSEHFSSRDYGENADG